MFAERGDFVLFHPDEYGAVNEAVEVLKTEANRRFGGSQELSPQLHEAVALLQHGREIIQTGILTATDKELFDPTNNPHFTIDDTTLDLSSSCFAPATIRERMVHTLRHAILTAVPRDELPLHTGLLRELRGIERSTPDAIEQLNSPEAYERALRMNKALVLSTQIHNLELVYFDLLDVLRYRYFGDQGIEMRQKARQINQWYESKGMNFWSYLWYYRQHKDEAAGLVKKKIDELIYEQRRYLPYQSNQDFNFRPDTLEELAVHDPLALTGNYSDSAGGVVQMSLEHAQELYDTYQDTLTQRDIIWLLYTTSQTHNILLAARNLAELKKGALERNIPFGYVDAYITSNDFGSWSASQCQFSWEIAKRSSSYEAREFLFTHVLPSGRNWEAFEKIDAFMAIPIEHYGITPEFLIRFLNSVTPAQWNERMLVTMWNAYKEIYEYTLDGPGARRAPTRSEREWIHLAYTCMEHHIPSPFLFTFLEVVPREQWEHLLLPLWRFIEPRWGLPTRTLRFSGN